MCITAIADSLVHFMSTLYERFCVIGDADPVEALPIVTGNRADYLALKPHHYRPGNPATMTRMLVVRDETPSAGDRFWKRPATARPIAVLVESLPSLSCRLRDEALGGRYGQLRPKPRSALLMQELRCISRVIVDPRYRGLGLAVGLVKHALNTATTRYTESIAVMGHIHPFNERAGMKAYERPLLESQQRAIAALHFSGIDPNGLAMPSHVEQRIAALPGSTQSLVFHELHRWYRSAAGRAVARDPTLADILAAAQHRLLASPVYYLHENTHVQHDTGPALNPDRSA